MALGRERRGAAGRDARHGRPERGRVPDPAVEQRRAVDVRPVPSSLRASPRVVGGWRGRLRSETVGEIPEPTLDPDERRAFAKGVDEFNRVCFFECHDTLEDLESLLRRALSRFGKYPGSYWGFDLDAHRAEIRRWLETLAAGDLVPPSLEDLPKWRFDWLGHVSR